MKSEVEILSQLDNRREFPFLDSAKEFLGAVRLTCYCSPSDWALTIEQLVFVPTKYDSNRIHVSIFTYGNCLKGSPGCQSGDTALPVEEIDGEPVFMARVGDRVRPTATALRIRGTRVPIDVRPEVFAARGVGLVFPPAINGADLLRSLVIDHREQLLATDEERRRRIRLPLKQILQLDEWHHPDMMRGVWPSNTKCFQMLASVLVHCDPRLYQPTEPANTDWRYWPRSGMM